MASFLSSIKELQRKAEKAQERHLILTQECERLREENGNLRQELAERDIIIERLTTDAEFLTLSHRLADNPDALIRSRRHIARLIRNLDTCISLLKE